jgi:hypothetical protein
MGLRKTDQEGTDTHEKCHGTILSGKGFSPAV